MLSLTKTYISKKRRGIKPANTQSSEVMEARRLVCSLCRPAVAGKLFDVQPTSNVPEPNSKSAFWLEAEPGPQGQFLYYAMAGGPSDPIRERGLAHHRSKKALNLSAQQCPVCRLISDSTEDFTQLFGVLERAAPGWFRWNAHGLPESGIDLILTKNIDGKDGFLVFTWSVDRRHIYLVAAIGFHVSRDESCTVMEKIERRISHAEHPTKPSEASVKDVFNDSTGATLYGNHDVLQPIASWITKCIQEHISCKSDSENLPSRVLDLRGLPNGQIRLTASDSLRGRYVALSHCWGSSVPFTTTKSTLAQRMKGIEFSALPKTFRDAIKVSKYFEVEYIWIDCLCICQDDLDEWAVESARMDQTYANAHFVIAADSAPDSNHGLFNETQPHTTVTYAEYKTNMSKSRRIYVQKSVDQRILSTYVQLPKEPLTKRGWVLQERFLAHRTLHFTSSELLLECTQQCFNPHGLFYQSGLPPVYDSSTNPYTDSGFEDRKSRRVQSRHSIYLDRWYSIIRMYSKRRLTRLTDKLPALSGLARVFETHINSKYSAGLWSSALIEGLQWHSASPWTYKRESPSTPYIAPSWSWASHNAEVIVFRPFVQEYRLEQPRRTSFSEMLTFGGGNPSVLSATGPPTSRWKAFEEAEENDIAEVYGIEVTLATSNPWGEVSSGWISMRIPLIPVQLVRFPFQDVIYLLQLPEIDSQNRSRQLEYEPSSRDWRSGYTYSAPPDRVFKPFTDGEADFVAEGLLETYGDYDFDFTQTCSLYLAVLSSVSTSRPPNAGSKTEYCSLVVTPAKRISGATQTETNNMHRIGYVPPQMLKGISIDDWWQHILLV